MSGNVILLLVLSTIIFASGLYPLALINLQTNVTTFTATTMDGLQIIYDVNMISESPMDAPVAILLHGFSGNRIMMRMIALALADKGFICASVDLRGHGSSEGIMGEQSDFGNDVKAVIQSLQTKRIGDASRIVLIGHSMGGAVAINTGSQLESVVATIGVAPVSYPEWVNTTMPRNLLLIISTGDTVINSTTVKQTFYKSVNGTLAFNEPHNINGTEREFFVVEGLDHLNILYNELVINEIVKWSTSYVLGVERSLTINPNLIQVAIYVSLAGGTIMILLALTLVHGKINQEKRRSEKRSKTNLKALLKIGCTAILIAGIFGPLLAIAISFVLGFVTPLFFTNFITSLFLGNSIILGLFARRKLKHSNKEFSYFRFVKESIKKPSLKVDTGLGMIGAIAIMVLLSLTLGNYTTSTFSMASIRLISLPLYTLFFVFVFVFYESFFKGFARSMIGDGIKRMVYSFLFELVILFLIFVLELFVITTILSLFMPHIQLGFFVLGLNLLLISLLISTISAEVFYEKTGGWITQIIISALIFATMTIVFSPALL